MANKKVYILSPAIGVAGGADKATKLLAEAYDELGYSITVFATSCEVKTLNNSITIISPVINYGHRWKLPQFSLVLKLAILSILKKPRFVHCVGLTYEVKLTLSFLKWINILVWETTEANKNNPFVYPGIVPKLKNAKLMLAPSETIKKNIIKNYLFKGPIAILPFWTDWHPKQNSHKKITGRLLYVGRLDKDKGFDCLFQAMRLIKNEIEISLDICGKGNINAIEQMAHGLSNVTFHGFVDNKKMAKLYHEADFLVLPSKHEGYPLSLIEASGKSIPIIASKVGSIPEIYQNSKAALLFDADNELQLKESLLLAFNESNEQYRLRREKARKLYERINNEDYILSHLKKIAG